MATATGAFEIRSWDEQASWEGADGRKLSEARVSQAFSGDVRGHGDVQYLMCYRDDGTARFVGLTRVEGSLGGREGSFVVESIGDFDGARASGTWSVVPGSATDALAGLGGEGRFDAPMGSQASLHLDYRLD
ncbi:MAG TPA: DUF3224 domain-containing protein [Acidimicrobiia bacterium]